MLMAGLDGVKSKIEPPEPMDKDLYDRPRRRRRSGRSPARSSRSSTPSRPTTNGCSREASSQDVVDTWIEYKRLHELDAVRLRPHPYEFALYYDL